MNKQDFEATDGGIRNGDFILVTTIDTLSGWVVMYAGRYDPIEDANHWYLTNYASNRPDLIERLINQGYTLLRSTATDKSRPQLGVYDMGSSFPVQVSYGKTLSVRPLIRSGELERFVLESLLK